MVILPAGKHCVLLCANRQRIPLAHFPPQSAPISAYLLSFRFTLTVTQDTYQNVVHSTGNKSDTSGAVSI